MAPPKTEPRVRARVLVRSAGARQLVLGLSHPVGTGRARVSHFQRSGMGRVTAAPGRIPRA